MRHTWDAYRVPELLEAQFWNPVEVSEGLRQLGEGTTERLSMLLTWTQPPTGPRLEVTGAKSSFVMLWNSHDAADSARIKEPSSASIRWVDATSTITVHGELFQKRTFGHPHSKQPHRNNDTKLAVRMTVHITMPGTELRLEYWGYDY